MVDKKEQKQKGFLVAVEGADKAGKHTQVVKAIEYLRSQGIMAETLDFPQYDTFFGGIAKDYLNGKFGAIRDLPAEYTMLPYALDRMKFAPKIMSWLDDGKFVILDRYVYSNSFSVAKSHKWEWNNKIQYMEDLEFVHLGNPRPDHNIYLYVDPVISYNMRKEGMKAYQNGRPDLHESDFKLLHDVSNVYKYIAQKNPQTWTVIDEMKENNRRMSVDEVFAKIQPALDNLILRYKGRSK